MLLLNYRLMAWLQYHNLLLSFHMIAFRRKKHLHHYHHLHHFHPHLLVPSHSASIIITLYKMILLAQPDAIITIITFLSSAATFHEIILSLKDLHSRMSRQAIDSTDTLDADSKPAFDNV